MPTGKQQYVTQSVSQIKTDTIQANKQMKKVSLHTAGRFTKSYLKYVFLYIDLNTERDSDFFKVIGREFHTLPPA